MTAANQLARTDQTPIPPRLPPSLAWLPDLTIMGAITAMPEKLPREQVQEVRAYLNHLEIWMKPASRAWISGRVVTLLAHYAAANVSEAILRGVAEDWLAKLKDLPAHAIQQACLDWLGRPNGYKPTPGEIRALACQALGPHLDERLKLRALLQPTLSTE